MGVAFATMTKRFDSWRASPRAKGLAMASLRAGIGFAAILAPSQAARVTGFPTEHDNPTSRTVGRLFGVRELVLAWLVIDASRKKYEPPPSVFAFQSAVDASDLVVQTWSILKRESTNRGVVSGVVLAASGSLMWARLAAEAGKASRPEQHHTPGMDN